MPTDESESFFIKRIICPICRSDNFSRILSIPYSDSQLRNYLNKFYNSQGKIELEYLKGIDYSLCECLNCYGFFQEYIPNGFLMGKLYEEWICPQKSHYFQQEKELNSQLITNYICEILKIKSAFFNSNQQINVLDYGMGWGSWAKTVKLFGGNVYGMEISPSRIENALKLGISIIEKDKKYQEKFNFINTEQVFEHLPEPLITLKSLKQMLKPNGIIKISVPTATNIKKRLKNPDWMAPKDSRISLNSVAPLEHINFYRRESICAMANLLNLEEVKIPVITQYENTIWNGNFKEKIKKALAPIRLNYTKELNYLFFKNAVEGRKLGFLRDDRFTKA